MSANQIRFAAVIGHSDEPEMLEDCIRHHLQIGVDHIFVSLNRPGAKLPGAFADDSRVRAEHVAEFAAGDGFSYFSDAMKRVVDWAAPDWVLFADSDEFWLPETGAIADTRGLGEQDLLIVERFNTPVLRLSDNSLQAPDLGDPGRLPLVAAREPIDDAYLKGDTQTPWIFGLDAPKLLVRPGAVASVGAGGHIVVAHDPAPRWSMPGDLLILHAPFTTEQRFRDKVASVREVLGTHGDRFNPRQAWHWRHWLTLDGAQLSAEFRRQSFRSSSISALKAQGALAVAQDLYPRLAADAADAAKLQGDALHEKLGRAIENYRRPAPPPSPAPAPVAARAPGEPWTYAPHREVESADGCYFYHCMDIPGHGEVTGQWDLRGREQAYLGGVDLRGREVLEIGTASGYLAFYMERQGANVTSFDLNEHQEWDIVPFYGYDQKTMIDYRKKIVRQINDSWWFTRNRVGSKARVIYGNVYGLDNVKQTFDVVTVNSVLLHLRDPFHALAKAAARSHDKIIVTDVANEYFLGSNAPFGDRKCMHFLPSAANQSPMDTWWFLPDALVKEFLLILGFKTVEITHHKQRFMPDQDWDYFTAVGTR